MPKRLGYLAAGASILGALAFLLVWRADRLAQSRPLKGLRPAAVSRLSIERQGAPAIDIERKGGRWRLREPGDLASVRACEELVAGLSGLEIGTEVSADASAYPEYDLTEAGAAHVKVYSDASVAPLLDGWFGKPALGEGSLYFRRAREKPVWIASGIDAATLSRPRDSYRERAFFPEDLLPIQSVSFAAGGNSLALKKDSQEWITAVNLRVADFPDADPGDAVTGLSSPVLTVEAAGPARRVRWLIGKAKPQKKGKPAYRYARTDDRPGVVVLVASHDADALLKAIK